MNTITNLTVTEYDQMIATGLFEPRERHRLELIRGELRNMSPIGSEHEAVVDFLAEWSIRNLPQGKVWVRVQNSIALPTLDSAPEPDVVWVARHDYSHGRPTAEDVLLIVEVAESSLRFDLGEKAEMYAEAGIEDYWVVDLRNRSIIVHRKPVGGRYADVQTHAGDEAISPLCLPEARFRPAALWAER